MRNKYLDKAYPELKGLSYDVQLKIMERANHEICRGKTFFWGTKPLLLFVLNNLFFAAIFYFIFKGNVHAPIIGLLIGTSIGIVVWTKYNRKLLRSKIRELAQNEKI